MDDTPALAEPVRVAVLGCGAVAAVHHLPALAVARGIEAAVLVDRDLGRARDLARLWAVPRAVASWEEAAGRFDAAIVALPNHLHAPAAIELLERGIGVLVEKPMAPAAAECDAMIAAAGRSGAALAVGLEFRFFPSTELVAALLGDGLLGELRGFELRQGVIPRWPIASDYMLRPETAGGGVLLDFGSHVLDLLLVWLGELRVVAYRDDARGGVESDCELELELPSGVRGTAELSRTRNLPNTCRFDCARGSLEVGIWDPDPEIRLRLAGREQVLAGRAGGGTGFAGAFARELEDFAAAVRGERTPRVPGGEGRRAVALIEACYGLREPLELPWDAPASAP